MKSSKVQKRRRSTIAAHALQRCTSKVPHLVGLVVIVLVGTMLTAGIAAAQSVALSGNHPKVAAGLTSRAAPDRALTIQVSFALRNRAELDKFLSDLQDPASPRYHQGLTPKQFDARFGRTRDEIEAVEAWLSREGFQILHASADEITCRVEQWQRLKAPSQSRSRVPPTVRFTPMRLTRRFQHSSPG